MCYIILNCLSIKLINASLFTKEWMWTPWKHVPMSDPTLYSTLPCTGWLRHPYKWVKRGRDKDKGHRTKTRIINLHKTCWMAITWVADHKHFYPWSIRHTFSIPLCHLSVIYFIFGCARSSLLCRLFSSCSTWTSHCCGSSCCKAQSLGCAGSSSCSK